MNHIVGPWGFIGPWLSLKLSSTVNITPILSTEAAVDCSHHELHGDIQNRFFRWVFGGISKDKFLSEVIRRET